MNVTFQRSYTKKETGNKVFVYTVAGTKSELEQYETAVGAEFFKTDEVSGAPLYFATKFFGDTGKLLITTNGNIVPDMSEFDKAASLASQFGGNLGKELARASAARLIGRRTAAVADQNDDEDSSEL